MDLSCRVPQTVRARRRKPKLPPKVGPNSDKLRGKLRVDGRLFQSPAYATPEEAADWLGRFRGNEKLRPPAA